jgi:aromatic ring-opening dioxygenase LigB subunit
MFKNKVQSNDVEATFKIKNNQITKAGYCAKRSFVIRPAVKYQMNIQAVKINALQRIITANRYKSQRIFNFFA